MPTPMVKPALLLIDVINAFDFEGCEPLVASATKATPAIEQLAAKARAAAVPVIYANDNFGQWRSDFQTTVQACLAPDKPGHEVTERLRPQPGDFFVLKPQHSAFYATPLELVLKELGIDALIIAGFATDLCVLFTAHDAHMRGYNLMVPEDCTASNSEEITERALRHLRDALHCETGSSTTLEFGNTSE